jgi:hypothetical protein
VHPRCITGIEITADQNRQADIKLIKWANSAQSSPESVPSHAKGDFNLVVKRTVLEPGSRGRMSEVRCQMSDDRGQMTEDRGRRTEDGKGKKIRG